MSKGFSIRNDLKFMMVAQRCAALFFRSVIAFAGEDSQVVIGRFHFDLAEYSVARIVRRIVAEGVLAAEFFGNFIEGLRKFFLRRNGNYAAPGFITQPLRGAHVGAAETTIGDQ